MKIDISYDQEFEDLINGLKEKYPKGIIELEGLGDNLDINKFSQRFFKNKTTADASIDENSNVAESTVISYHSEIPKPFLKLNSLYMLWKELKKLYHKETADRIIEEQISGDIYINDATGVGGRLPYCFAFSTYDVALKGLPMISKIRSIAPKYLLSFTSQVEQFTIIAANSILGASAIPDFLCILSWYVERVINTKSDAGINFKTEEDCWNYIKEKLISFVFTINQPTRASQSAYTNISIYDDYFLDDLLPDYIFPDGTTPNKEIVKKVQTLFIDIMNKEMERTPITFPVTVACCSVDEENNIKDKEFLKLIAEKNQKFGFINIFCGDSSVISGCCRLRSDNKNEYFNTLGAGSSKIGSLGVVTINLPRLAFKYKNNIFERLTELTDDAARINNAKRKLIQKAIEGEYHPLYSLGFMDIGKQYSTTGINGFNECIIEAGYDPLSEEGINFGLEIINTINKTNDKNQKQYKSPHNAEQIPGESASIKLAKKDKLLGLNTKYILYSNQFIPLTTKADMLDRIRLQGIYDKHFTGGAACHVNIETAIDDPKKIETLIESCAKNGIVYFSINYNIQECENGHMSVGKKDTCNICGAKIINNYTRTVGYLSNTKNWIKERREEDYPNRQFY